jgi:archaellum biogenesis protein FlaJ (TadC family)
MNEMKLSLVRFFNVILAALLAGTSFGIWLGFNPKNYSTSTYLEQQQNLIGSLNTLMISLVVLATMVTLPSAFLQRKNRTVFVTLLAAAAFFISCMLITRFGNVPIQTEMLTWEANAMPANWTTLRDKWWSYHMMRTIVELIALVLVTWTIVQHKTTQIEKRS